MDNPLFLVTKGLKARKKRLGSGGGIATQVKTAVSPSTANLHTLTLASCDITVIDLSNGQIYNDGNTTWNAIPVDDYIATSASLNGLTNLVGTIDGVLDVPAAGDYEIVFECAIAQHANYPVGQSVETLNINVLDDPQSLVNGNDIRVFMNSATSKGGSFYRTDLPIVSNGTNNAGSVIFTLSWTGCDTANLSPSNLANKSAQPSDVCCIVVNRV